MRYSIEDGSAAVEVTHGDIEILLVRHAVDPRVEELVEDLRAVVRRAREAAWYDTEFFPVDDDRDDLPAVEQRRLKARGELAWLLALAAAAIESEVFD